MNEVVEERRVDRVTQIHISIVLQVHGEAANQSIWANLLQELYGFGVLKDVKTRREKVQK